MARRVQRHLSPQQLRRIVAKLEERQPIAEHLQREIARRHPARRAPWYRSQKQHWLGWLGEYDGPGFYGRSRWDRSAKFVYNHIQCPPMLLWLAEASGLPRARLLRAKAAALSAGDHHGPSTAAIRSLLPWDVVEQSLRR
jgi:hypothetical protein